MRTIKFIKRHPSGIEENAIHTVADHTAQRLIAQGYAVAANSQTPPVAKATGDDQSGSDNATDSSQTSDDSQTPPVAKATGRKNKK